MGMFNPNHDEERFFGELYLKCREPQPAGPSRYKIQYSDRERFATWSDWMDAGTPLPHSNILSIITEQTMTLDEWNAYARQYLNPKGNSL